MDKRTLSPLAEGLIHVFEEKAIQSHDATISVNPFISEIASWYEKLRNAMDYREDEVVLRVTIERILKRRLLLGGSGEKVAEPLVRELLWARYFPDSSISESDIAQIAKTINLHLALKKQLSKAHTLSEKVIQEWFYHLLSCDLSRKLNPSREKEAIANFIFHITKDNVIIKDDTEDTKNAQVFLAVRRAFAKDDLAFLRYHLFLQIFGELTESTLDGMTQSFPAGCKEIEKQLDYPLKEKIFVYIKKITPIFFILEDVLRGYKGQIRNLSLDKEQFQTVIVQACEMRYKGIISKVRRAIIRSVLFLLFTKAFFAVVVEGTYERVLFGQVLWGSIALNTTIPPFLMIIVSLFIKTPNKENSLRIFKKIDAIFFDTHPRILYPLSLTLHGDKSKSLLKIVFALLWLMASIVSFGAIIYVLTQLHFNIVSQVVFLFFLTIVSFLSYRISLTAHIYNVETKQGLMTPFIDFLFLPIVRTGMRLTEGISQINIIVFIFDFLIEAPFKGLFSFFEQWFIYLHTKRDGLE